MKQKLLALVCALALVVSLAGCVISTPDTVGSLGDYEISSGLYLLAQYDAYQKAADLASSDQDAANVKAFLKQTITVDSDSGETATVSDYVARKTLENLQTYAATELRFDELGGQLTAEEEQQADSYAQQLMDQYGDTYKANGIGLETVQHFERILLKSNDLLTLVYGNGGETPVSDADLTEHLENNMVELAYYVIPLYNTSTYAFADDDQKAQMLTLAQQAASGHLYRLQCESHRQHGPAVVRVHAGCLWPRCRTSTLCWAAQPTTPAPRPSCWALPRWTPRSPRTVPPTPSAASPTGRRPPCSIPATP